MLALLFVAMPVLSAGTTAQRVGHPTLTEPGRVETAAAAKTDAPAALSGSVNVAVYYRGRTASEWAARFRHRTKQLQAARRTLHQAIRRPVYGHSWLENAFLCIHRYEGSWTDSGAPFWGGLQMDSDFMAHYGGWALRAFGTADKWPVSVQLSTAIQAKVSGRGFYPWPNTARTCGLI